MRVLGKKGIGKRTKTEIGSLAEEAVLSAANVLVLIVLLLNTRMRHESGWKQKTPVGLEKPSANETLLCELEKKPCRGSNAIFCNSY